MEKVQLLNIQILNIALSDLLMNLKKGFVITPNVDHLIKLQKDREFYEIYQKADYVILDSRVLYRLMKYLGIPVKETIPGSDLFPAFCEFHKNNEDVHVFLLGSAPGVADKARKHINQRIGREIIIDSYSPSYSFEKNSEECNYIIKRINSSAANVLAVGVGAPKQEKWIDKFKSEIPGIDIYFAIGATIDFEARAVMRAPLFFQVNCLEWLYRLYKEPKRLWRRYLVENLPIFYLVWKQKKGIYKNPFNNSIQLENTYSQSLSGMDQMGIQ